jgi:hypothetical protein
MAVVVRILTEIIHAKIAAGVEFEVTVAGVIDETTVAKAEGVGDDAPDEGGEVGVAGSG